MCEPVTIGAASLMLVGKLQSGVASRDAAYANASILEDNAKLSDYAAGDALQRGQVLEGRIRLEGTKAASKAKSQLGASGVDVQSGSAVDVQAESEATASLDALTAQNNAAREAWGYRTQASQFRKRAALARREGANALTSSILGGFAGAAQIGAPLLKVG